MREPVVVVWLLFEKHCSHFTPKEKGQMNVEIFFPVKGAIMLSLDPVSSWQKHPVALG
jgi:hypothetical protein